VAVAQFLSAVFDEASQRAVDVAEAEEAEVMGMDGNLLDSVQLSWYGDETPVYRCPCGNSRPRLFSRAKLDSVLNGSSKKPGLRPGGQPRAAVPT
jgi:hypothetical protein